MSRTLNDLIEAAVSGAEETEEAVGSTVKVAAAAPPAASDDIGDVEKLASALEFIARRGVANVLDIEKTAMKECPDCGKKDCKCAAASKSCPKCKKAKCDCGYMGKKASGHGVGLPPGTNDGKPKANTEKPQVGPHSGAPSMKVPGYGLMPNNDGSKPGGGASSPDTSSNEKGTHHKALSSNEAAIAMTKKDKTRRTSPALSSLLDAKPYSDPTLKRSLSHTDTDKNIHSKKAHDAEAVRTEIARRVAAAGRA